MSSELVATAGAWLGAFAFTQAVEVPIYRRALGGRTLRAFGASAITHPVVWFVFPVLFEVKDYWVMVAAAETFAVASEGIYLRCFAVRRALLWSLAANAASLGLGLLSRALFAWP